jgi:hypothetical protein
MVENKVFTNGGLNQDVDESLLKPNDWDYALNIRNTDRLEFSDGVLSNLKGNTLVTYALPTGTNKCIGSYANESSAKFYSFIYNSLGNHTITEYDNATGVITKVLQASYLNFQPFEYINGVGIIDNKFLYWTDGFNPPRNIDIEKAKASITYYTDATSISLAKPAPQDIIDSAYANDPINTTSSNRLKNQLFQFRYLYIYEDGSRSAWSSCSEVPLPNLEITSSINTAAYRNNHITLQFNVGTKFVKSIEIAAQVKGVAVNNTQDWFSILTINRAEAIANSQYEYNLTTNKATFQFYNDGLYQSVDINEIDLAYDYVPLKSKALDIVNGNVLVLGNNTEGYDNIALNANITVGTIIETNSGRLTWVSEFDDVANQTYSVIFTGTPIVGDTVGWTAFVTETMPYGVISYSGIYTVTDDVMPSITAFADALGNSIMGDIPYYWFYDGYEIIPNGVKIFMRTSQQLGTEAGMQIEAPTLAVGFSNAGNRYKTNSKYQFGLVYYDEFNRSSYVQTNTDLIKSTKSWGALAAQSPKFDWVINHSAPLWAKKYQWVRTEQLTHKTFLFWNASAVTVNSANANYYDLNISSFNTYNTNNKDSILAYDFSKGDRCTIHKDNGGFITGYDVSIVGYNPTTGILTIDKKGTLTVGVDNILLEIYTPKTRSNQPQEQFFYEFGEVYSCNNGVHSVTSGSLREGDIYVKGRVINGTTSTIVEDPNFSDFYKSNYSSNGRVNVFAPQAKQLTLPTDIRYSDTYVPNTNINGLNRFYGDAFETYDRVNGSIQKLAVRDNYLVTFQELKTGYIPIQQSIIEDQGSGGSANVAISNKLLNKIRYFAGDYGIGLNPESFARFAGTMYFADPNRAAVLKLTSGLQQISGIGMDSYFTRTLSGVRNIVNTKLIGSYDPRNDEYILTINKVSGDSETIAFNEAINRWTSFYSFIPEHANYIFNKYMSFKGGSMWEHNTNTTFNSFYGINYYSYIDLVFNANPLLIKTFVGLMQKSNTLWTSLEIVTSTPNQLSSLNGDDFLQKEGVWFASFLRDINSPEGLYGGDDLKGNWIKVKLTNSANVRINTLAMSVRDIPSYQGIK